MKARLNKRTIDEAEYQAPRRLLFVGHRDDRIRHPYLPPPGASPSSSTTGAVVVGASTPSVRTASSPFSRHGLKLSKYSYRSDKAKIPARSGCNRPPACRRSLTWPTATSKTTRRSTTSREASSESRRLWDRCVLPKLGKRRVADIHRKDIAKLMTEMAGTPSMANKVLTQLSKAFNLGRGMGMATRGHEPVPPCQPLSRGSPRALPVAEGTDATRRRAGQDGGSNGLHHRIAVAAVRLCSCSLAVGRKRSCGFAGPMSTSSSEAFISPTARPANAPWCSTLVLLAILQGLERVDGNPFVLPGHKQGRPDQRLAEAVGSVPSRSADPRRPHSRSSPYVCQFWHQQRPQPLGHRTPARPQQDPHDPALRAPRR